MNAVRGTLKVPSALTHAELCRWALNHSAVLWAPHSVQQMTNLPQQSWEDAQGRFVLAKPLSVTFHRQWGDLERLTPWRVLILLG